MSAGTSGIVRFAQRFSRGHVPLRRSSMRPPGAKPTFHSKAPYTLCARAEQTAPGRRVERRPGHVELYLSALLPSAVGVSGLYSRCDGVTQIFLTPSASKTWLPRLIGLFLTLSHVISRTACTSIRSSVTVCGCPLAPRTTATTGWS
jgi:hypothetical protein